MVSEEGVVFTTPSIFKLKNMEKENLHSYLKWEISKGEFIYFKVKETGTHKWHGEYALAEIPQDFFIPLTSIAVKSATKQEYEKFLKSPNYELQQKRIFMGGSKHEQF